MAYVHAKRPDVNSLTANYKFAKCTDKTLSKIVCDYRRIINLCNNARTVTDDDLAALQLLTHLYKLGATHLKRIPHIREVSGIQFDNVQLRFSTLAGEDYVVKTSSVEDAVTQLLDLYNHSPVGGTIYDANRVFKIKRHFKYDLPQDVITLELERYIRFFLADK